MRLAGEKKEIQENLLLNFLERKKKVSVCKHFTMYTILFIHSVFYRSDFFNRTTTEIAFPPPALVSTPESDDVLSFDTVR